jgi:L-alanine-DL-glutamate epimerase-like enolase superfamily enzyme
MARDEIWDVLFEASVPMGLINSIDVALWDLWGRAEGKPVHALLGTERDRVKVYVSTSFDIGDAQAYADYATRCRELGFRGFKIHPYIDWDRWHERQETGGLPDRDIEAYRAVAETATDSFAVMTDNFCSYGYEDALRVGGVVDDLAYRWYESPMPETEEWIEPYARLRNELQTPICAPELAPGSYQARLRWIEAGACDICRTDFYYGGFTAGLRLAEACRRAGIPLELHVGDTYQLQLIASVPEDLIEYYESFSTSREERTKPGRLTPEPVAGDDGCIPVPDGPGMGVELDWDLIARNRIA